ncbi:MAG: hypothetical protein QOI41_2351 [Myxococcales bacterium]|jgi:hypothetical protein|nr:hypothetical protein [Myxococcales bacterium]
MKTNEVKTNAKKKTKETVVFALIALSIVLMFGGFALVSRGVTTGWIGIAASAPMLLIVQRAMRAGSSAVVVEPKPEEGSAEG